MSDNQTEWRRTIGNTGKSAYVTIPYPLSIEMGIKKGVVVQIKKHDGWIAIRVDPSQNPVVKEPPVVKTQPATEPPVDEPQKDEAPKQDNRVCGFD